MIRRQLETTNENWTELSDLQKPTQASFTTYSPASFICCRLCCHFSWSNSNEPPGIISAQLATKGTLWHLWWWNPEQNRSCVWAKKEPNKEPNKEPIKEPLDELKESKFIWGIIADLQKQFSKDRNSIFISYLQSGFIWWSTAESVGGVITLRMFGHIQSYDLNCDIIRLIPLNLSSKQPSIPFQSLFCLLWASHQLQP